MEEIPEQKPSPYHEKVKRCVSKSPGRLSSQKKLPKIPVTKAAKKLEPVILDEHSNTLNSLQTLLDRFSKDVNSSE